MSDLAELPATLVVFWAIAGGLTALSVALLLRALPVSYQRPSTMTHLSPLPGGEGQSSGTLASETLATRRLGWFVTLGVPLAALGLYASLGRPDLTAWRTRPVVPPFIASAVEKLEADTTLHPDDKTAWVLLGGVYGKIQRYGKAEDAYRHALALAPEEPALKAALGEMLVRQEGGRVGPEAAALFAAAHDQPMAAYYLALARSQTGDWAAAMAQWQALLARSSADDPWFQPATDRIHDARRVLGMDQDR